MIGTADCQPECVMTGPSRPSLAGSRDVERKFGEMADTVPFAGNYTDVSTYDGYQFEFYCRRCGNGHRSAFRPAVTSFGGRIAELGGSLLGGELGSRIQQVGMFARYGRSSTRGVTNDQRLREAAEDVADQFRQCRGCTEWVCRQVCWNEPAGLCHQCAAQRQTAVSGIGCPSCGAVGSGRFCGDCGTPLVRSMACRSCGADTHDARFCGQCGTQTG
jgi:hypothetical protein